MGEPADLTLLRAFCAAAELGTIGRAAVRLTVSQPAVSRRVRALEDEVGVQLLRRSPHGVQLTVAGRRLYEQARDLLIAADEVADVMAGLHRDLRGPVRLSCSHSAFDALIARMFTDPEPQTLAVELVSAVSRLVRDMVADGRADVGVAAGRPRGMPNPGVREIELASDPIVCGVPPGHPWARRPRVRLDRFLATPMVVRDLRSNTRATVEAVLRERHLQLAEPVAQSPTPLVAVHESRVRGVPLLVSRQVLLGTDFVQVEVAGVSFPRSLAILLPERGEPSAEVREVIRQIEAHARIWLR